MTKDEGKVILEESIGYLTRILNREFQIKRIEHAAKHDIQDGHWYFLRALWLEDGLTQKELSKKANVLEPTAAVALASMEKKGLITRIRSSIDRRKIAIKLTPEGKKLCNKMFPIVREINDTATNNMTKKEITTLIDLLHKVTNNLENSGPND